MAEIERMAALCMKDVDEEDLGDEDVEDEDLLVTPFYCCQSFWSSVCETSTEVSVTAGRT